MTTPVQKTVRFTGAEWSALERTLPVIADELLGQRVTPASAIRYLVAQGCEARRDSMLSMTMAKTSALIGTLDDDAKGGG